MVTHKRPTDTRKSDWHHQLSKVRKPKPQYYFTPIKMATMYNFYEKCWPTWEEIYFFGYSTKLCKCCGKQYAESTKSLKNLLPYYPEFHFGYASEELKSGCLNLHPQELKSGCQKDICYAHCSIIQIGHENNLSHFW